MPRDDSRGLVVSFVWNERAYLVKPAKRGYEIRTGAELAANISEWGWFFPRYDVNVQDTNLTTPLVLTALWTMTRPVKVVG